MAVTVLLVEDDQLIASSLARALTARGYRTTTCSTVLAALASISGETPDLVLLDLGLPDGDGSEVASHLAAHHPEVPIVVLTARSDEIDVVLSLESGAVDHVIKPFRLAELLARIAAHLRLADALRERQSATEAGRGRFLVNGDLEIDTAARRVSLIGREIAMRPKEFDLLARLARDAGMVVKREQLIDDVWDQNWWGSTKTLDVHINAIRRKLGDQPGSTSLITTVRGVGYRLEVVR